MVRLTRMGAMALCAVVGLALTAGAADKAKKPAPDPITYNVTAKDLSEEYLKRAAAAQKKYSPAAPKKAFLDIDGYVKSVDNDAKTVTLDSNPKVVVILKAKKITGEKDGKRVAIAKKATLGEFNAKDKKLVIECDEVILQKLPE